MFFIRTEGNPQIGMGHMVRCISIASAIGEYTDVNFFCSSEESKMTISENGFEVKRLSSQSFSLNEASEMASYIKDGGIPGTIDGSDKKPCILVDSYHVNNDYFKELKKYFFVIYLDDLINEAFLVDICVNYNGYAKESLYKELYSGKEGDQSTKFVTGCEYIPLRKEFTAPPSKDYSQVSDVLIMIGGSDFLNLSEDIVRALNRKRPDFKLHVVCGRLNPNLNKLKALEEEFVNVMIHVNVSDMVSLMDKCDVAISAGGSTVYELCQRGLPFVVFSYVDNQKGIVKWIEDDDIAVSAKDIRDFSNKERAAEHIGDCLIKMIENKDVLSRYGTKNKELVDGRGAQRLAEKIIKIWEE